MARRPGWQTRSCGPVGDAGPYALLAGLFVLTAILGQLISNTATALIIIPIAVAAATGMGVSPRAGVDERQRGRGGRVPHARGHPREPDGDGAGRLPLRGLLEARAAPAAAGSSWWRPSSCRSSGASERRGGPPGCPSLAAVESPRVGDRSRPGGEFSTPGGRPLASRPAWSMRCLKQAGMPGKDGPHEPSDSGDSVDAPKTFMQKLLDGVERVGNKVPHPAVIFIILIGLVIVLSHILYLLGARVAYR